MAVTAPPSRIVTGPPAGRVPRLEPGDRLDRLEFERRYAAMPALKKAELLEGVVYMPSPVSLMRHAAPHSLLVWLCGHYALKTPGIGCADNATLRLDMDSEPQPDVAMFIEPDLGGQARVDADGYLTAAPELVIEVASSSRSYDLHVKLRVYRRHGVREYVVHRVDDGELDWFVLEGGEYVSLAPAPDGAFHSRVFPGFRIDPGALVNGDRRRLAAVVDEGAASAEHAAFVSRLAGR